MINILHIENKITNKNKIHLYKNIVMTTPCYTYDMVLLENTLKAISAQTTDTNFQIHYAVKANYNKKILEFIADYGFGADCVSGQEIMWALEAGFASEDIVFAGVGKTDEEIGYALESGVKIIHCEGVQEAITVNEIAGTLGIKANIALRLNPDIEAGTHKHITTGLKSNKFGFSLIELNRLVEIKVDLTNLNILGLHFHIGSQITNMSVFKALCCKVNEFITFYEDNFGELEYLNVGGGLGINYEDPGQYLIPDFKTYFNVFKSHLSSGNLPVHFELGRSVVGQCGKLLTKVLYVKESEDKRFAVVDAGMTELLRPALYNAQHEIEFVGIAFKSQFRSYDVVGPVCESTDCLGRDVLLPNLRRGDVLAIKSCGAYAESMQLSYNGRKKISAVYM